MLTLLSLEHKSERKLDRQLKDSWIRCFRYLPEGTRGTQTVRSWNKCHVGKIEVGMIEDIEALSSKLRFEAIREVQVLED